MPDVLETAAAYGVRVEMADLGDWGAVTLLAEYDPHGPVIRLNERAFWRILRQAQDDKAQGGHANVTLTLRQAQGSKGAPRSAAVDHTIAHELYHHREAIGEIARILDRPQRERAADAFADALVRAR